MYHVHSGSVPLYFIAYLVGAGVMALGGIAEVILGVAAERRSLEDIATPLSAVPSGPSSGPLAASARTGFSRGVPPPYSK